MSSEEEVFLETISRVGEIVCIFYLIHYPVLNRNVSDGFSEMWTPPLLIVSTEVFITQRRNGCR